MSSIDEENAMSISKAEINHLITLYHAHLSIREISRITKHTVPFISRMLKENGVIVVKYNKPIKVEREEKFQTKTITTDIEMKIVQSYLAGIKLTDICQKLSIPMKQILNVIYKKHKLKKQILSPVADKLHTNAIDIVSKYNDGTPISQLAIIYDVNDWSIKKILNQNNVVIRQNVQRKYTFNENFFYNETPELYYFMGFYLADGSIWQNRTNKQFSLSISLHERDLSTIELFCDWLSIDKNSIHTVKGNQKKLEIHSQSLFQDGYVFSRFGVVPNKTYAPHIPIIPDEFLKPFILGLIDGDGHIVFNLKQSYHWDLVCNKQIIIWYIDALRKMGYTGKITEIMPDDKIWGRANITRKNDVKDLAQILEIKNYSFILERKWKDLRYA